MKFLHLLLLLLQNWYTKQIKFVIPVAIMFYLSSFLIIFAATYMGTDIRVTAEQEAFFKNGYLVYAKYYRSAVFTDVLMEDLSFSSSNSVRKVRINADITISDIDSDENVTVRVMPVLNREYEAEMLFLTGNLYTPYTSEQHIKYGREITTEDIETKNNVIILPEYLKVPVGDTVTIMSEDFQVIGTTDDVFARLPSSVMEKYALKKYFSYVQAVEIGNMSEVGGVNYDMFVIELDKPMTQETEVIFNESLKKTMDVDTGNYSQPPDETDGRNAIFTLTIFIVGGIIAIFAFSSIYYAIIRLCAETLPFLSTLKLCGMRPRKTATLLFLSVVGCLAVPFSIASATILATADIIAEYLDSYSVSGLYFAVSAAILALAALIAMLPPIIRIAATQPIKEVEV